MSSNYFSGADQVGVGIDLDRVQVVSPRRAETAIHQSRSTETNIVLIGCMDLSGR